MKGKLTAQIEELVSSMNGEETTLLRAAIDRRDADLAVALRATRGNGNAYIVQGYGDIGSADYNGGYKAGIHVPRHFKSLNDALLWLETWGLVEKFDPEDDRVVVWEQLPTGHRRPVWHASGWHWEPDRVEGVSLPQGEFPGWGRTVYDAAMKDY